MPTVEKLNDIAEKQIEIHTDVLWIKRFWWLMLVTPASIIVTIVAVAFWYAPKLDLLNTRCAKIEHRVNLILIAHPDVQKTIRMTEP